MEKAEKISNKNGNWYIVEIIEKCEPVERNEKQELRRVTTWGNHHLIKADSPEKAFDKAVKLGKEAEYKFTNSDKIEMEWIFVGIGELLPIYEDIEDGAELMWNDYGFISNRRTMRMPYKKKELMKLIKPKQQPNK
ncbi:MULTISPECIES: DUF4288 domain-containing protein [Flavobacteriaceae]|jgi:hypothetical protein|uniref:DUF4288 domain-containing protein n=1 Tax=Cellulophaga fucicola TaxID=76595 RepID=A0A1K1RBH2_9FLAO|nr:MULTISPECIES: DUF4288 domain-containing protein [Flavobacteriaceae]SFW69602.1 protein of unknown function [Cellulophaga fucicola]